MKTAQPYILVMAVLCFIAPLILLISYIKSKPEDNYLDEKPFHKSLRAFAHLSLILLVILNLGWLWALYLIYGTLIGISLELLLIIGAILMVVLVSVIDALIQRHLKTRGYNFFHWVK